MKVLLLTTHLNVGGIAVYVVNLARKLKEFGIDVIVASSSGDMTSLLEEADIRHYPLNIRTKSEFGFKVWRSLPALITLIRKEKVQLIHSHTRVVNVLTALASRYTGVPFVTTCHGFYKYRKLSRKIFPCWGKRVIAISRSVYEHLLRDFKLDAGTVDIVYNGIDLTPFRGKPLQKNEEIIRIMGGTERSIIIGSIGRLSPVKGFRYLIESFGVLHNTYKELRLLIAGDGPEKLRLKKLSKKLGLSEKIFIAGNIYSTPDYLSVMDIFCMPSVNEGLGMSLMEAMASGKPCVASDVGGLKELIRTGENGILVPPGDARALAEGIKSFLENGELRQKCSKEGRNKALKEFSIDESVSKIMHVYRKAVGSYNN